MSTNSHLNDLHRQFENALSEYAKSHNIDPDDLADSSEEILANIIPEVADIIIASLKQRAPGMLREHRDLDEGFRHRNYKRWAEGFDLLARVELNARHRIQEQDEPGREGEPTQFGNVNVHQIEGFAISPSVSWHD